MTDGELAHGWHALLFGVRRSIRYHSRRRAFFDRFRLTKNALTVLLGSVTLVTLLYQASPKYAMIAPFLVTVLASIDLVVDTAGRARVHQDLCRKFVGLEKAMSGVEPTPEDLRRFTAERLDIEAEEPPIYRVLDALCHNEQARAEGQPAEQFIPVKWYQRWFAHFFDLNEHALRVRAHA